MNIYSLYDSKVGAYLRPLICRNHGEALRAFAELANDKNSSVGRYPADFTLFYLGSFDDETGGIEVEQSPRSLGIAQEFVELMRSPDVSQ